MSGEVELSTKAHIKLKQLVFKGYNTLLVLFCFCPTSEKDHQLVSTKMFCGFHFTRINFAVQQTTDARETDVINCYECLIVIACALSGLQERL